MCVAVGSGSVMQTTHVDRWISGGLVERTSGLGDPGLILVAIAAATVVLRFVLPSRPTMLLLALAVVPAAPQLGISPWLAGLTVLTLSFSLWTAYDVFKDPLLAQTHDLIGERLPRLVRFLPALARPVYLAPGSPGELSLPLPAAAGQPAV